MPALRYTLLSDGSSDRVLLPVLSWLLHEQGVSLPLQPEWADLRRLPHPPERLPDKILRAIDLYPCDLLFIHRDAENQPRERRVQEINLAVEAAQQMILEQNQQMMLPPEICVVPVRMQEAWLLISVAAIRSGSGNPHGQIPLVIPAILTLENLPDPKDLLHELLRSASETTGRRRKQFSASASVYRVAEFIEDYSPLRQLPAFHALETDLQRLVIARGWNRECL